MNIIERAKLLRKVIENLSENLNDEQAISNVELFPHWDGDGHEYEVGNRTAYNSKLYKCRQNHTSQAQYTPDITPALWVEVERPGQGDTPDNPIPYNNNMELFEGKYYSQNDVVYICFRSTGTAVYNNLADLVGLYVNVWTEVT